MGEMPQADGERSTVARPRIWTVVVACLLLFLGMGFVTAASVLVALVARPDAPPDQMISTVPALLGLAGATTLLIAGLALAAARLSPESTPARLGLRSPSLRGAAGWLVAIAGGLALSQAVDFALRLSGAGRGLSLEHMLDVLRQAHGVGLVAAVLVVGVGAGAAEELFFRGYVQRRLVARFGAVLGVVVTSFLFALAHLNPQHSAFAFVFGLYLGGLALWSGSTWPAIAVHVANNTLAVLLAATGVDDATARVPPLAQLGLLLTLTLGALAAVAWIRREALR